MAISHTQYYLIMLFIYFVWSQLKNVAYFRFAEIRNTQQGKLEERLPWFSLVLPPWMAQTHPQVVSNLRINSQRLTSPFDIYPTLADVLHLEGTGLGNLAHRSISLFKEVAISLYYTIKERGCKKTGKLRGKYENVVRQFGELGRFW